MKHLHRLFAVALAAFFMAGSALAQNAGTVTNHAFPIGKGAGVAGYTSLLCGAGTIPVGQAGADPICQSISGDITISAAGVAAIGATVVHSSMLNADVFSTAHTWAGQQTFIAPILGTPASGLATNLTGLPLTTGVTGILPLANGGCNANLTASNGGIFWSNASQCQILAGTATARLPLLSGATAAPVWGAYTLPSSVTSGGIPFFSSTSAEGSSALLVANQIMLGGGAGVAPATLGSLGSTTTVLHGNAAGAPSFASVTGSDMAANTVANGQMATMAANTVKGNATGGVAAPTDVAPATARSSSLLNVDSFTGHGDSIYTIQPADRTVGTNAAFTASRTWTLPAANAVNPGQEIIVADYQGTVTGVNTLVISRAGADTVNGGTAVTISAANGAYLLKSDGISRWTAQALGAAAAGGVSSVTCFGTAITTSGTCVTAATKSDEQAGSSATAVVTPSQQQQHDSAAKAHALLDGSTGATCTVKEGYNITSCSRAAAGSYTLTFTTSFAAALGYACTIYATNTAGNIRLTYSTAAQTVSAITFHTSNLAGADADSDTINVACFGRQ